MAEAACRILIGLMAGVCTFHIFHGTCTSIPQTKMLQCVCYNALDNLNLNFVVDLKILQ